MTLNSILDSKSIPARHALLSKQFEDLLKTIRSLEGFKTFLQCPPKSELLSLAESGSIVVFNVSDIRSDPFLITSDAIRSVPLPDLLPNSVDNYVGAS